MWATVTGQGRHWNGCADNVGTRRSPRPAWRDDLRAGVRRHLVGFVRGECVGRLADADVAVAGDLLSDFLEGGKYVRSTFMYLGWLCGAGDDAAALRASASLELLHAFALIQDDVMDASPLRRAAPSAHVVFTRWHRERALAGSSARFGESAAILLGDLCLVWAEEMLRRSGVSPDALARVWPRYDGMRTELAIGQFSTCSTARIPFPSLDDVLDVLRRKSGNYTVRRPLEIGAAMAGCDARIIDSLSGLRHRHRRGVPTARRPSGCFRKPLADRQTGTDGLGGAKGHQRHRRSTTKWPGPGCAGSSGSDDDAAPRRRRPWSDGAR